MKRNIILTLVIISAVFITSINTSYAQCSKEKQKEHNCSQGKETDSKVKTEVKECAGEHAEAKIEEIEKLHKSVAELWHKNYPSYNLKKMRKDTEKIIKMFPKLESLQMPKGFENKSENYKKAFLDFQTSVKDLSQYLSSLKKANKDDVELKNKVEKMHTDFHTITEVF